MQITNYVRRCKNKHNSECFDTLHAADNNRTFCGKELNEMWWVESSFGLSQEDVNCKQCRKVLEGL